MTRRFPRLAPVTCALVLLAALAILAERGSGFGADTTPVAAPALPPLPGVPGVITIQTQTRDAKTEAVVPAKLTFDTRKAAVVIIDPWNYHWCMTWSKQAGDTVPRMNHALKGARQLGMTVIWAPTDVASMYTGTPQRERALAFPYLAVPKARKYQCAFTLASGPCHCGPGHACLPNYGHDAMPADIDLAPTDLIASGTQELYSICRRLELTHLIYFGGAVNLCLTGKPEGLQPMYEAGIDGLVARDMVEAWTHYDPAKNYTSDTGNAHSIRDLERAQVPTVHFADTLRGLGLWDESAITEPVRVTPAGQPDRPYVFDDQVTVTLTTPWIEKAEIRYTTDGSEPAATSPKYDKPLVVKETTSLRTAAFRAGKRVSLESTGFWVKRPPEPPKPTVYLDQLTPVTDQYAYASEAAARCLWKPVINTSFDGQPLRIRAQKFAKGVGMRAPAYLRYELKNEWSHFVAQVGVADNMLDVELGRNIARFPSVVFKVFIDGRPAGQSPVMRISQPAWRFHIPIPPGSRQITLCATDAGDRSPYDLANWVEAGFVVIK